MPQVTDIRNTLADRLWVLFEAQATITAAVVPNARNKGTKQGWLRAAINDMPTGHRQLTISFAGGRHSLFTGRNGTFAREDDDFTTDSTCDFDITRTHNVVISYSEPMPKDTGEHRVVEAIEQTLILAGPTLGLPDLIPSDGLGEATSQERETRGKEYPKTGRITIWRFPITTVQSARAQISLTA